MPKISAEEGARRRKFALEHWMNDPTISVPRMNDMIKQEFNGRMNTQHLYRIRQEVQSQLGVDPESLKKRAKEQKGLLAKRQSSGITQPVVVPLRSAEQSDLLKSVFAELSMRGWCNLVVEFTKNFAIINK